MSSRISVFEYNSLPPELQLEIAKDLEYYEIDNIYKYVDNPGVQAGLREIKWEKILKDSRDMYDLTTRLFMAKDIDGLVYIDELTGDIPWEYVLDQISHWNKNYTDMFKKVFSVYKERREPNLEYINKVLVDVLEIEDEDDEDDEDDDDKIDQDDHLSEIFKFLYNEGYGRNLDLLNHAVTNGNIYMSEWLYQQGEIPNINHLEKAVGVRNRKSAEWLVSKGIDPLDLLL